MRLERIISKVERCREDLESKRFSVSWKFSRTIRRNKGIVHTDGWEIPRSGIFFTASIINFDGALRTMLAKE